jgi:hypothetical protein
MKNLLNQIICKRKALILQEAAQIHGFLRLLMKQVNTDEKWTGTEKIEIRKSLKDLSLYVPGLTIFRMPFGMLLVPVLAETLDRRSMRRSQ